MLQSKKSYHEGVRAYELPFSKYGLEGYCVFKTVCNRRW